MDNNLYEVQVRETRVRVSTHYITASSPAEAGNLAVAENDKGRERTDSKVREIVKPPKLLTVAAP